MRDLGISDFILIFTRKMEHVLNKKITNMVIHAESLIKDKNNIYTYSIVFRPNAGDIMAKSMKLGGGGRFEKLKKSIAKKGNVSNPAAVAAAIGRKKYGAKKMAKMAAAGRKRASK